MLHSVGYPLSETGALPNREPYPPAYHTRACSGSALFCCVEARCDSAALQQWQKEASLHNSIGQHRTNSCRRRRPACVGTYGGGFIYHHGHNRQSSGHARLVSVGLVAGLDFSNPYLNPREELQRRARVGRSLNGDCERLTHEACTLSACFVGGGGSKRKYGQPCLPTRTYPYPPIHPLTPPGSSATRSWRHSSPAPRPCSTAPGP